ncbi:MAG: PRC-barrel domain-containing protein [Chloroflexota bacterium]
MRGYQRASQAQIQIPRSIEDAQGRDVVCRGGKRLGHVVDVLFDDYHRDRLYLEVESDGKLEFRHKHFITPVDESSVDEDPIFVDVAYEEIGDVPTHDPSQPFSEEYEAAVFGFWGTQMHETVEAVRDPFTEKSGELHSMRPEQFDDDPHTPHANRRNRRRE